jgi:3-oxoacyl-(acyl-carrier-protein) synthase
MNPDNVVITGIGMVTSLGATAREIAGAWLEGKSALPEPLEELKGTVLENLRVRPLPPFDAPGRLGGRRMMKFMSKTTLLGSLAAREALADADARERFHPERIGIYAGTGLPALDFEEVRHAIPVSFDEEGRFSSRLFGEMGLDNSNPLVAFKILPNMPPCIISLMENIKGPSYIFTPWEGQTASAIHEAWLAVRNGEVDCALTGGADTPDHPMNLVFLKKANLLEDHEHPSSGAAYLVLERADSAMEAGRHVYARLVEIRNSFHGGDRVDPLAQRIGKTFAAAPAIFCGITALTGGKHFSLVGADGYRTEMLLEGSD